MTESYPVPPPELVRSRPVDAMIIPPSTEPSSLCVGSTKNLCAGWYLRPANLVFEGTEEECRQYFQDSNVSIAYNRVFMVNRYRETVLRPRDNTEPTSKENQLLTSPK